MDTASVAVSVAIGLGGEDRWVLFPLSKSETELISVDDPSVVINVRFEKGNFLVTGPAGRFAVHASQDHCRLLAAVRATQVVERVYDHELGALVDVPPEDRFLDQYGSGGINEHPHELWGDSDV